MGNPIRVLVIGGIRTHYIKINAIQRMFEGFSKEFRNQFEVIYVNAAQHYDYALTCHIEELGVRFDYNISQPSKNSYDILSTMFTELGKLIDGFSNAAKIDYVIVMGDVATTAVSALVAAIKHIKVVHIEAGVRIKYGDGNEEYYRTVSDHSSSLCFAATLSDYNNLVKENFGARAIYSGDIIYDFVKDYYSVYQPKEFSYILNNKKYEYALQGEYVLASLHHVENINKETISGLFYALHDKGYHSIFIAHPRIKQFIEYNQIETYGALIVDAIPYLDNLRAIKYCKFCITDSGGIQREAYYANKRCIVRSETIIWKSILETGNNLVCGASVKDMMSALKWAEENADKNIPYNGCFGSGNAVKIIFEKILQDYILNQS